MCRAKSLMEICKREGEIERERGGGGGGGKRGREGGGQGG